jgi:hypothetical protein
VDPTDGSCWTGAQVGDVVHLAEDGGELWRCGSFARPDCVSANCCSGSCWVADSQAGEVALIAKNGTELWRGGSFGAGGDLRLCVNPVDGSCWVADGLQGEVVRLLVVGYEGPSFPDIPCHHWAYGEIEACAGADIVRGYPDGLYRPAGGISRDQMAVYISRSICTPTGEAGLADYTPPGPPSFGDVPAEHWAYKHIEYAAEHNVVLGYEDGCYHPEWLVTRDQMAVYVARAMHAPTGEAALADYVPAAPRDFADVPAQHWAYEHVEYCVENGVVEGYPDGHYHPEWVVTRDQMAVYVARAFGLLL